MTEHVPTSFIDTEDDHNFDKPADPAYRLEPRRQVRAALRRLGHLAGARQWSTGRRQPDGRTARRTASAIAALRSSSRPEAGDRPDAAAVYVAVYGEWTKKAGIGRDRPGQARRRTCCSWDDCRTRRAHEGPQRRRVRLHARRPRSDYPDYYLTDARLQEPEEGDRQPIPQQKDYHWTAGTKIDRVQERRGREAAGGALPARPTTSRGRSTRRSSTSTRSCRRACTATGRRRELGFNPSIYTSTATRC